jgi:hypoxanthine phosphoribosyltransferase
LTGPGEPNVTILFEEAAVAARVQSLAAEIATRLPTSFTLVGLLKGAFVFTADLTRALDRAGKRPRIEFMRVSSYGTGTESSGIVSLMGEPPEAVKDNPVLLVDDIQDTGRTLRFTRQFLLERGATEVWACALLDKPARREVESVCDFVGFTIPDLFVVGYGIDWAERFRHLPFIGRLG